jgi:hypothetical protein
MVCREFLRRKEIRAYIPLRDKELDSGKKAPTAKIRFDKKSCFLESSPSFNFGVLSFRPLRFFLRCRTSKGHLASKFFELLEDCEL